VFSDDKFYSSKHYKDFCNAYITEGLVENLRSFYEIPVNLEPFRPQFKSIKKKSS
jgi:hypothetical protein